MNAHNGLTGPVAITGAHGHVGRALLKRLGDDLPNPIRALGRSDDWAAALRDADAVIHLAGTLQPKRANTYRAANLATAERVVQGTAGSGVRRIAFLSYVGADPDAANEYLRTKGQAEELIRHSGIPSVIFRSTFIYGDLDDIGPSFASYQTEAHGTVTVLGDGTQKLAPIHVDDLAGLLAAAALHRSTPTGTFDVGGAEILTVDDFVRRINPAEIGIRHLPDGIARLLAWIMPQLTPALVDVLLADSVAAGDPVATADRFGVSLRPLEEVAGESDEVAP